MVRVPAETCSPRFGPSCMTCRDGPKMRRRGGSVGELFIWRLQNLVPTSYLDVLTNNCHPRFASLATSLATLYSVHSRSLVSLTLQPCRLLRAQSSTSFGLKPKSANMHRTL